MCRAQWMTHWVRFKMQSSHLVCFFFLLFACYTNWLFIIRLRATTNTNHHITHQHPDDEGGQILNSEACSFSSTTVSTAPTTTALNDDKWGSMERLDGSIRLEIAGEFLFFKFFHLLLGLHIAQVCLVFDLPWHEDILEQGSIQYLFNPYISVDTFTLFSNQISTFGDIAN